MHGVSVDFPRQLKCCCNACRSLAVFLLNLAFAQHAVSKLQPTAFVLLDDKLCGVLRCFPARMPDKSGDCPFFAAHADASVNMDFGHSLAVVAHRPRNGEWANHGHARQKQFARLCVFQRVRHIRQGSALQNRRLLNPRGKVAFALCASSGVAVNPSSSEISIVCPSSISRACVSSAVSAACISVSPSRERVSSSVSPPPR